MALLQVIALQRPVTTTAFRQASSMISWSRSSAINAVCRQRSGHSLTRSRRQQSALYLLYPTLLHRRLLPSVSPFYLRHLSYSSKSGTRRNAKQEDTYDEEEAPTSPAFQPGDKVLVEVVSFGPLGASVHVMVAGSHAPQDLPPDDEEWPVLGVGLISQQELAYFRDARQNLEVVLGEILPAYIERIRESDGKMAIGLRAFGGKAKASDLGQQIVDLLETADEGVFGLGDKSSPGEIASVFPGVSKSTFKKALSALYKKGIIGKPQANEIRLMEQPKE